MKSRTMRTKLWITKAGATALLAAGTMSALAGCELIVDFDRSKIPQGVPMDATIDGPGETDGGDGGNTTPDATATGDGATTDAAGDVATTDATADVLSDAGSAGDASDASAEDADAAPSDGASNDGTTDADGATSLDAGDAGD
jgi:hypothetical protein